MLKLTHCVVDLERRVVQGDDGTAALTTREARLLGYLAQQREPVSREDLLREVWGYNGAVMSRTVDNTVSRLRAKIEIDPTQPAHLLTEYGVGYRLVTRAEPVELRSLPESPPAPMLVLSDARVDLSTGQVFRPMGTLLLKGLELGLLRELVKAAGPTIDRAFIERRVWGNVLQNSSRLENLVCRLRAKIERDPAEPVHLLTARGHGYRFVLADSAPASGVLAVLAVDLSALLDVDPEERLDALFQRLWASVSAAAEAHGGYISSLSGARAVLVFGCARASCAAGAQLARRLPEASMGLSMGVVRRLISPLSQRFEYLGPAVDQAMTLSQGEGLSVDEEAIAHHTRVAA